MYRPPTWTPSTPWARRLDAVMRERDWSKVELFEELGADLGYRPKSRTALYPLLRDKDPSPTQEAVLVRHFGPLPAETPAESVEAPDLATALLALARELAASREERASLRAELDDLHELVGRLAQERLTERVPEGSRATGARPQTVG